MSIKEVERIRGNNNAIEAYRTGMNQLFQAGIIDAIRVLGRPRRIGSHDVMGTEGAWSSGWNDCLDTLLYFQEKYLEATQETPSVRMDFGAIDKAVQAGDLTEGEADAIRDGNPIKYDPKSYTRNIEIPKRPASKVRVY